MNVERIQRRVFISGKVQGVFFRESAVREAAKYAGLAGYVRNLMDGRVEVLLAGEPQQVSAMVEWCRRGPPTARIASVNVIDESDVGLLPPFVRK